MQSYTLMGNMLLGIDFDSSLQHMMQNAPLRKHNLQNFQLDSKSILRVQNHNL